MQELGARDKISDKAFKLQWALPLLYVRNKTFLDQRNDINLLFQHPGYSIKFSFLHGKSDGGGRY
jgi:hypothetical protein